MTRPPEAVDFRKARRETSSSSSTEGFADMVSSPETSDLFHRTDRSAGFDLRCAANGRTDALVGAAPADVAGHGGVDIRVAGTRLLGQQCAGGHDLAGLAIPALRYVELDPGLL